MPRRLTVRVGRESPGTIEVPETFETTGTFALAFENDGRAVHVHVALDDDLARVVSVDESNHFLESDGSLSVPIRVASVDERVSGDLELVTGYGSESRSVTVAVGPPPESETPVDPGRSEDAAGAPDPLDRLAAFGRSLAAGDEVPLGLAALSAVAVVVALWTAVTVGGLAGVVGALLLVAGVGAAVWLVSTDG